ncbi:MAG: hypothetical protein AVDCRST_MAG18-2504, partial [uncultured Thermomicrobiales bacterium]
GRREDRVQPGEGRQEEAVRLLEAEPDGVPVDLLDGRRVDAPARGQLLIELDGLVPEEDIIGGERLAVRPAQPLAQPEGVLLRVRAEGERLRDVGNNLRPFGIPADQILV